MVKKTLGRRKVEIVKMTKESNLQVTFSKRKAGLFKKASELCTLCDAKIAMIVFSPAGKVFSFGHPNVDVLLDHFRGRVVEHNNTNLDESYTKLHVQMLNKSYTEVKAEVEKEQKNKQSRAQNERENENAEEWWSKSPLELNLSQSTCMIRVLKDLKKIVDEKAFHLIHQTNPNFYFGSSSNAAAPATVSGGNISTNQGFFDQNGMTPRPPQTLLFGFNIMNRTPGV
ncbi:Transcription factor MADS-box [Arabidopsis suecica]|uniref:Transcription factor MADS-box n=2 Tax=Arabidopsis TaxID=3701 RepID=A0A8T2HG85_ARASU|nr:Transcription factor MADS-box [Arabidopsis suecica]